MFNIATADLHCAGSVCVCVCVLLRVPVFVHGNVILVVLNVFFMSTGTPAVKQQVMDRVTPSMR